MQSDHRNSLLMWYSASLLLLLLVNPCAAQTTVPAEDPPRLVVDFRGPVGRTRALGFAGSDRRFFSAGENKRLQFYDVVNQSIVPGTVIRWEFARGALGEINAVAASTDGRTVVLGGSSLRNSGGDIILVNTGTQAVLQHFSAPAEVVSLAISADGSTIIAGDLLAGVTAWQNTEDRWQRTVLRPPVEQSTAGNLWNPVAITQNSQTYFLTPAPDNTQHALLTLQDVSSGTVQLSTHQIPLPVTAICTAVQGSETVIAAASADGHLVLHDGGLRGAARSLHAEQLLQNRLSELSLTTMALSADATLVALAGDGVTPDNDQQVQSFVALLDLPTLQLRDLKLFPGTACCESLSFSPTSSHLLACDDTAEMLLLWALRDDNKAAIPQPLQQPPQTIRARSRSFRTARFFRGKSSEPQGYQLLLTDSLDQKLQFEPGTGELETLPQPSEAPVVNSPDSFATGWSVEASPVSDDGLYQTIRIVPPAGSNLSIPPIQLSVMDEGTWSGAFAFLKGTDTKPAAVAIGTQLIDGIFLYRIPQGDGEPPTLVRYFRDHAGAVRDLSISTDQRFIASCAADRTVRIWSLSGWDQPQPAAIFGGHVQLQDTGKATITELNPAGILYARGLRDGDVIAAVKTARQPDRLLQDPRQIEQLFARHPASETLDLWLTTTGFDPANPEQGAKRINPGWEPLLTLVADQASEWVIFTPEGWFDASIASGDRLFGWQINRGVALPPRFEPAEHLQRDYEKPDVIRRVLQTGSVPQALAILNQPVVGDLRQDLRNRVLALPEIRIVSPLDGLQLPAIAPIPVTAEITFSQPQDAVAFEIQAAQNGRALAELNRALQNNVLTITWTSQALEVASQFSVTAREIGTDLASSNQSKADVMVTTTGRQRDPRARVFLLGLAVDAYQKIQPLQFSVQSVSAFQTDLQRLTAEQGAAPAVARILADAEVSASNINQSLQDVLAQRQQQPSPDDLIIVLVSGQGVSRTVARGSSIRLNAIEEFFFLPPAVDPKDLRQLGRDGIRWKNVCDPINQSNCDVLWIIDASHSARARNEAKAAFSECRGSHGRHVIFTDQTEAVEAATWQLRSGETGSSSLLLAVREALSGSSLNPAANSAVATLWQDQTLSFDDLAQWSVERAHQLAVSAGKRQNVLFSPTAPNSALQPLILGTRKDSKENRP